MKNQEKFVQPLIIFFLTFIIYSNTINHQYALDDSIVITENQFTKKGFKGLKEIFTNDSFTGFFKKKKELVQGGRYRPLSIATFAIEYQFFGQKPSVSHLINILLYGITGIMIWFIIKKICGNFKEHPVLLYLPVATALLFVFHPLHTEVVANIKGRDEILALLLSLLALFAALKYSENLKPINLVLAALCFFPALLSKENAATFIVLIPLSVILFKNLKIKHIAYLTFTLLVAFIAYYLIRVKVAGGIKSIESSELMNNPFLEATAKQKYATIFYTLGLYLKLLVFPHPLTFDYYPYHITLQHWDLKIVIILAVYLLLTAYMIFSFIKFPETPSGKIILYGITFMLINLFLVSNIPFNLGTFMNERFIYIASFGFCLILGLTLGYISTGFKKQKLFYIVFLSVFLLLFGIKTYGRNKVWKNNYTLFTTDVKTSTNSAKSNCSAGGIIYETALKENNPQKKSAMLAEASEFLKKAIRIHPGYADAWRLLGNVNYEKDNYKESINNYLKVLEILPDDAATWQNIDLVLNKYDNTDEKIAICDELLKRKPLRFETNYMLGNLYGKYKNNLPMAIRYLKNAIEINPNSFEACKDIGVAFGLSGNLLESLKWLEKALKLNPDDAEIYINLGITYYGLNRKDKAMEYLKKGEELKKMK